MEFIFSSLDTPESCAAGLSRLLPLTHERKEEAIQKTEEMKYNREEERQLEPTEDRHVGMHT